MPKIEPPDQIPASVADVEQLEDLLSRPSAAAVAALSRLAGDIMLLGVGGKMGPTLARMAVRASEQAGVKCRVIGVSRFSTSGLVENLQEQGVETISCDLADAGQLARLPDVPNIIYMTGMKFGATGNEALTWMMNVYLPGMICQRFAKSRIVAFSTGNVYGLSPVALGGSLETDALAPVGEYAITAVGRERICTHFSQTQATHMALLRLNYAQDLRYGVLVDLARTVAAEQPVDLAMGNFNAIWQGDANAMALAAFGQISSPPRVLNLAGPETLSVRRIAEEFGRLLEKRVTFRGVEAAEALLSNGQAALDLFGYPRVGPQQMIRWIADWTRRGGEYWGKPTHFENRAGSF